MKKSSGGISQDNLKHSLQVEKRENSKEFRRAKRRGLVTLGTPVEVLEILSSSTCGSNPEGEASTLDPFSAPLALTPDLRKSSRELRETREGSGFQLPRKRRIPRSPMGSLLPWDRLSSQVLYSHPELPEYPISSLGQ